MGPKITSFKNLKNPEGSRGRRRPGEADQEGAGEDDDIDPFSDSDD